MQSILSIQKNKSYHCNENSSQKKSPPREGLEWIEHYNSFKPTPKSLPRRKLLKTSEPKRDWCIDFTNEISALYFIKLPALQHDTKLLCYQSKCWEELPAMISANNLPNTVDQ